MNRLRYNTGMGFFFKKMVSGLLLPLPIAMFLLLIGLILFWCQQKRLWTGSFLTAGFLTLILFGYNFLPAAMITQLESHYHPMMTLPPNIHRIVVLGGGVRNDPTLPPSTQLSAASISRLVEGIRLYRLYKNRGENETLILSGGKVFGRPAEAGIMQSIAVLLGVAPKDIALEAGSRDTHDEALYLKSMLGNTPFILVTSATHMPRAIALFKKQGLHPVAAPTSYVSKRVGRLQLSDFFPSANNLGYSDIAIHEYLGKTWAKFRGQTD